jgi:hypothetical protein
MCGTVEHTDNQLTRADENAPFAANHPEPASALAIAGRDRRTFAAADRMGSGPSKGRWSWGAAIGTDDTTFTAGGYAAYPEVCCTLIALAFRRTLACADLRERPDAKPGPPRRAPQAANFEAAGQDDVVIEACRRLVVGVVVVPKAGIQRAWRSVAGATIAARPARIRARAGRWCGFSGRPLFDNYPARNARSAAASSLPSSPRGNRWP